jgi:hypothetical protein
MYSLKSAMTKWILAALANVLLVPSALGADPNVLSTVTAVPTTVTYSRPADTPPFLTYAAYEITITNNSTNVLNNVRVEGSTTVTGSTETAPFVTSSFGPDYCTRTNSAETAIRCSIGQLRGNGGSASFVVIFRAPSAGSSIQFAWNSYYGEGSNDNGAHVDTGTGAAVTTLGTPTATEVKSFALPGGSFFTGVSSIASDADKFTTKVTVPAFAKAEVVESTFTVNCDSFFTCWQSDLTIPGTFDFLTIVLSADATNIKPGTKIDGVAIRYQYLDANNVLQTHDVGLCASPTTPRSDGLPCIASRVYYKNKTVPGWTLALDQDFVWTFISLRNGSFRPQ